jgi:uncharacterized protein YjgD (DUF1641 family)
MTAVLPTPTLEDRLDRLSDQVDAIADELRRQREAREQWAELTHELVPVTRGAMDLASRELADLSDDVTAEDLARFARTAARAVPQLEAALAQLGAVTDLMAEVTPLAAPAMATLTDVLAEAEQRGYFTFARGGFAIADRVVTSFGEDDVAALGDNVVLILNTLKEMTQPEVMTMLQRTALTAQHMDEPLAPPSTLALLRQFRDPEVRRGLGRLMAVLRTLGEASPTTPPNASPATPPQEGTH